MNQIDINCDMGESYGNYRIGNDDKIFPFITSANIACGFHGGDPVHMEKTITQALVHNVKIGAHPGYPDLAGFGRRAMQIPSKELVPILKYQIAALKGMAESLGGRLSYVKPHGALYNKASGDEGETRAIIQAIQSIDDSLIFMGLAGSVMEDISKQQDIPFVAEAFADRSYEATGRLMSRSKPGAVISNPVMAAKQVLSIVQNQKVNLAEGSEIVVQAQSICIHGDNPAAIAILEEIQIELQKKGIRKQSFAL